MKAAVFISVLFFALPVLSQTVIVNTNPSQATLDTNDNNVLKYALTLESLEATFYKQFNAQFGAAGFALANYNASVFTNFQLIETQEASHVTLLNNTLIQRTGQGFPPCVYNFSAVVTVENYVALARLFENVGTFAYDGAIDSIYNRTLQQAAATIATVEARHAAYLNRLPGTINLPNATGPISPFPAAFDSVLQPPTVADTIKPFLASCPFNPADILPTVIAVIPVPAPSSSFPSNPTQNEVSANDLAALNYALSLELLEATFYNNFMARYNVSTFTSNGLTSMDYDYFNMILAHENAHVAYLTSTITNLGGKPVANCSYNFAAVTNFTTFIGTAKLLENTGVAAYDGAVNRITNPAFREAAATVATVEARHAAYLNQLTGTSPFPLDTDTATPPEQIIATVNSAFITSCPAPLAGPANIYVFSYNGSVPATSTTSTSGTSTSTGSGTSTSTSTTSSAASLSALCAVFVVPFLAMFW